MRLASLVMALMLLVLAGCGAKSQEPPAAPSASTPTPPTQVTPPPVTEAPKPDPKPAPVAVAPTPPPRPQPELSFGLGVMVENSAPARPHSGLNKAELVYELEAEYGITRFLALFYQHGAAKIGPVRSARMGFYEIVKAYGVPYGHAGGNPDVFDALYRDKELPDLDDIYTCGNCFWRSNDRKMPHNLYTSTEKLTEQAKARKVAQAPLHRFPEGPAPEGGKEAGTVSYSWGKDTQDVAWRWDGKRFLRSQSGTPHTMDDGSQIAVENLIIIWTNYVWVHKGEWQHDVTIVGSGDGYLFREGKVYPIKWSKPGRREHYRFTLADGNQALLAPGQTWVSVLKSPNHLTYGN